MPPLQASPSKPNEAALGVLNGPASNGKSCLVASVDDLLHTFLTGTTAVASPAIRVGRALRQLFVAPRVCVAIGAYRGPEVVAPAQLTSSAQGRTLRQELTAWDVAEAQAFLARMASEPWPQRPVQIAPVNWSVRVVPEEQQILVGVAWADETDGFVVWSRLQSVRDLARADSLARALDRDLSNMRLFASAIRSVHHVARVENLQQRTARLRSDLDELLLAADAGRQGDLRSAASILGAINQAECGCAHGDLHEQIRRVSCLIINRTLQARVPLEPALVQEVAEHLCRLAPRVPSELGDELRCVASCIAPDFERAELLPCWQAHAGEVLSPMGLFALAAREHACALHVETLEQERSCAQQRLPTLCAFVRDALPPLLCSLTQTGEARGPELRVRSIESFRLWLRLWLVYDVASIHDPRSAPAAVRTLVPEQVEVFRALACVLCESLREQLYAGSVGFISDPELTRDALRVLVQHHARWKSGVPRELDLPGHLDDVASIEQGNMDAAEHLDHVLDVYITGYFVANLRVGAEGQVADDMQRVALHIVGQVELGPSPKAFADFQIAFALAALFHDAGMMLFPRLPPTHRPAHDADDVAQALSCIRGTVCEAGRTLVDTCSRELELHECIDLTHEPELSAWIERQRAGGTPNHALLSAWYLLKVCTRAACLRPEVIRSAVRATLLHGALAVNVDSSEQPVAALLVVCDEICDWEPGRATPRPMVRDGRQPNVRSKLVSRACTRTRTLGIVGLWCSHAHGELHMGLNPCAGDGSCDERAALTWPRIVIGLQSPRQLSHAVLEVWLRSAQNIGRIRRTPTGWAPSITLEGAIPPRLLAMGQDTRTLLDATAQRTRSAIRGRLHHWLENTAVFPPCSDIPQKREAVQLLGLGRPLATEDIAHYLPDLLETAFQVLEERERSLRT